MGWVANMWFKELYLLTTASPTVKKICVGQTQLCLGKIGKSLIFRSKPLFLLSLLSKLIITLLRCSFSFWFFSFFLLIYIYIYIYIYKSNEKFIKLSKKCHPSIQKGYTSDKYNQTRKLQASIKAWTENSEWLPITDNQSNRVLKKKSFRSGIVLSESSKLRLFLLPNVRHQTMTSTSPIYFGLRQQNPFAAIYCPNMRMGLSI